MTIGERIKDLRESKKITQTELADAVGTTKQNIYKYETGIITNIPSDRIEAIAKYFNISPAHLMGWERSRQEIENSTIKKYLFDDTNVDDEVLEDVKRYAKIALQMWNDKKQQ